MSMVLEYLDGAVIALSDLTNDEKVKLVQSSTVTDCWYLGVTDQDGHTAVVTIKGVQAIEALYEMAHAALAEAKGVARCD